MLDPGTVFRSPGGSFSYVVQGPVCRLYDREELPWPCCRLSWRGKEPSWNRVGRRLVGDIAVQRFPSYAVLGYDRTGQVWESVVTDYTFILSPLKRRWWYSRIPAAGNPYPDYPGADEGDHRSPDQAAQDLRCSAVESG